MSFCTFLCRIFIFTASLALTLTSLAIIGLLIWIRCDDGFEADIRANLVRIDDNEPMATDKRHLRIWINVFYWNIIGFSIASTIIGAIGMIAAIVKSRVLLILFDIALFVLVTLEIGAGIAVLVKRAQLLSDVSDYVFDAYNMKSTVDIEAFVNRYNCCGAANLPRGIECFAEQPTCTSAVVDRLDFTMMIFGICMLVVIILEIFTWITTIPVIGEVRKRRQVSYYAAN